MSEEICICFNKAIVQSMFKHVAQVGKDLGQWSKQKGLKYVD